MNEESRGPNRLFARTGDRALGRGRSGSAKANGSRGTDRKFFARPRKEANSASVGTPALARRSSRARQARSAQAMREKWQAELSRIKRRIVRAIEGRRSEVQLS